MGGLRTTKWVWAGVDARVDLGSVLEGDDLQGAARFAT